MRVLVVALVLLSGCASSGGAGGEGSAATTTASHTETVRIHNLTFADSELEGSASFEGTFLPHENGLVDQVTGVDTNGARDHPLELPTGRPVLVRAELQHNGEPGFVSLSIVAPGPALYSSCFECTPGGPLDVEQHLLLAPGDAASVRVRQAIPSSSAAVDYEVVVSWHSPLDLLYSGIPFALELAADANVTITAPPGHALNGVFVYGPDGGFLGRLDDPQQVAFLPTTGGEFAFLHVGHGGAGRFTVTSLERPDHRIVQLRSESDGRRDVPALRPGEEHVWEDEAAAAPVRVTACTFSQAILVNPSLRVDFPGGGSMDNAFQDAIFPTSSGLCVGTPIGDDRLYAGTYTTTYSNEGAGDTWVETTFTFLDR